MAPRRVLTAPNLVSLARIALLPAVVALVVSERTTHLGLALFAVVAASDWVDGQLARRLGQETELGKVLDPTADRLAIGAGILALGVRDAFPWPAAVPILARDALVLAVGLAVLAARGVRIEVRWIGKFATLNLMVAVTCIAWGRLGYPLAEPVLLLGWLAYAVGIATSYAAGALYLGDLRRALRATASGRAC